MIKITKKELFILENKLGELESRLAFIPNDRNQYFCEANGEFRETPDYCSMSNDRQMLQRQIDDVRNILNNAEVIKNDSSEEINLGSKFVLTLGDIEGKYILNGGFDYLIGDEEYMPVSVNSPLGVAVCGLCEGDLFSFKLPDGQRVKGTVKNIIDENEKVKDDVKVRALK